MPGRGIPGRSERREANPSPALPFASPNGGGKTRIRRAACSAEPCSAGAFPAEKRRKANRSPALLFASQKGGGKTRDGRAMCKCRAMLGRGLPSRGKPPKSHCLPTSPWPAAKGRGHIAEHGAAIQNAGQEKTGQGPVVSRLRCQPVPVTGLSQPRQGVGRIPPNGCRARPGVQGKPLPVHVGPGGRHPRTVPSNDVVRTAVAIVPQHAGANGDCCPGWAL